ncbi:MAG: alpha-amylase/4-alpha-glucanotransferase domain-containing protein [Bacteroidota bacterium]
MKKITTVFAVHNHQPIGNFDKVFEEAYQYSYKPFLDVMGRHPSLKITQHWTGPLLEWLVKHHPELIEKMREMVKRGQLELLTGAYYEAILAIIPEADRVGQIRKLSDFIHKTFDFEPRGMWLAERVWEQPLVGSLARAGVEFVMVDDTHFKHAGVNDDQLLGYYITEEQGATVRVLPIDKTLRYTVPFRPLEETLHYLLKVASEDGRRVVINADDGEKFGVWPKTFKHVYEDGWLEQFCRMIEEHKSVIATAHLSTVVDEFPVLGQIYLPTASYSEMLRWALSPTPFLQLERFEQQLKDEKLYDDNAMFVRGGYWRNFLAKYPESNHMHKKMLRVAQRARATAKTGKVHPGILERVWAGQCNDPYWHGVFGGLYLPNLRFPVYRSLLEAEAKLDTLEKKKGVSVEETDFDCDGHPEILVESPEMNLYLKPSLGGSLVELDYKPIAFNLLDIVSRREEGYHRRLLANGDEYQGKANVHDGVLMKEEGLDQHLHFDWYRRASLLDHFYGPETTLESFATCKYLEAGDFVNRPYSYAVQKKGRAVNIVLERSGALWLGQQPHKVSIRKTIRYEVGSGQFIAEYVLENGETTPVDVWFGIEMNVGLMAGDAHDRYYEIEGRPLADKRLRSSGQEEQVCSCKLVDEWLGIEVELVTDKPATLWRCPIETVSLSEAGFERVFQSSVVVPHWKVRLENEFRVAITQSITQL